MIIPKTCLSHLSLKPEVIEAVKAGKFTLWAVESVFDAMALLFNLPFDEEDKTENDDRPSIYSLVHQQIEQGSERETSGSIWAKLYQAFRKH